ncbi:MAG: glycosyltransferase [Rhodobacter sp.]|nr:glycosyltransferase [Paracoccaceae bacterium]MCC0081155.1 glycosyltransferase [Rhodobacter sp.]
MASLVMLSPAPLIELPGGEVVLDVKFVESMKLHCQLWPGSVRCIMRRTAVPIEDPVRYAAAKLGFDLIILNPGDPVPELLLDEASLVYVAADDMQYLHLPQAMLGRFGKLVYTVEEPLSGHLAQVMTRPGSIRRRLGSLVWTLRQEPRLRAALKAADGIQCDGYPAHDAYRRLNPRALRFLDNRIRTPMFVRGAEQQARAEVLRRGDPLRLAWFGQLDPQSGVEDLVRLAHLLDLRGLPFTLALFGSGPLEGRLRDGIAALGLKDRVTLAPMGAFDPVMVPWLRREADLFLHPRRLPTPQGSYVEALGCGLPILGYRNRMWRRMQAESQAGWAVRKSPAAMARFIERLHADRESIIAASARGVEFARKTSFEAVFASRMTDLREIAGLEP